MMWLFCAFVGLLLGSFINAWVWRLHEQAKPKAKQLKVNLSINTGRSVCTHCGHTLSAADFMPVVSWLWLKGKCRYCKQPISVQYPLVELITAVLFGVSFAVWPLDGALSYVQLGLWLVSLVILIALAVYDTRWMELPDKLVAAVTVIAGLVVVTRIVQESSFSPLWGALLGVMSIAGLFYVLFQVSGGKCIGGGDVKIGVSLGMLAGSLLGGILVLFVASLVGLAVSLPLTRNKKHRLNVKVPFGPFLIVATVLVVLFGAGIISWYQTQILLL